MRRTGPNNLAFIVALAVLVASSLGMSSAIRSYGLHLRKKPIQAPGERTLLALPTETKSWKRVGSDRIEPPEVVKTLGTDNYVSRVYVEKHPADASHPIAVEFHAAYYTGMIDTVPHVPDRCFVGGGWSIGSAPVVVPVPLDQGLWRADKSVPESDRGHIFRVRLSNRFGTMPGTYVRLPRDPQDIRMRVVKFIEPGGGETYAGYFFVANGSTVARAEQVRLLAFDLKDDYAYYLKVQFTSGRVGSAEELAQVAASLLDELFGEIMLCVPDWVEVERGTYPAQDT